MTTISVRLMIAAAALAVATTASAQILTANIPFAFRAGNEVLPAGSYRIDIRNAAGPIYIVNYQAGRNAIVLPVAASNAPREWRANGEPVLAFECGLSHCALAQIWAGDQEPSLSIPRHRLGRDEQATVRFVHVSRTNGD